MHRLKSKLDDNAAGDAREFLTLYDEINEAPLAEGAERLRDAYQRMMANFIRRDNPFVTPSSLLIDDQNKFVPSNIVAAPDPEILHQWLSERAHCGLPNEPVFPLPPSFNATDVGKRIAANYKKYRRQVVVPALGPLVGCRDLLVLVDVAGILELGPQWKNALVDAFSSIVGAVSPRGVMWRAIHNVGRIAHGRWIADYVHRVWFVAAQCDRVHRNEHERLLKLLDSLMRQATREHAGDARLKREKIRVAAIDCVRPGEQGRQNYFCRTPLEEIRLAEANPVALPEEFADDWPAGVYAFPKPAIMMPKNRGNPPRQFGLDCLTERLLGLR